MLNEIMLLDLSIFITQLKAGITLRAFLFSFTLLFIKRLLRVFLLEANEKN